MKKIIVLLLAVLMITTMFTACGSRNEQYDTNGKYIDLHVHLDGAITVEIAKKLAELQNIDLGTNDDKELEKMLTVPEDCKSLNDFLECFELPLSLMQTYEGPKQAAYLVAQDMYEQGVVYAEIRYAPQYHKQQGMTQEDAINAVLEGVNESSLKANIILCIMRGEGNEEENLETLELAKKYLVEDGGVVGLDLAGAEALYPTENYRELFEKAYEYDIPFTIHAGEADGPESVRAAIEFGARRIGHGVRIYEDEDVVRLVKEKGIYLEMCPTSSRQTVAIEDMSKYPLMYYISQGINVIISTDDPAIEGTTIAKEFDYVEKEFGMTASQKKTAIANAIDAAFTSEAVKQDLRKEFGL